MQPLEGKLYLWKGIGLGHGSDRDGVVNLDASGVEGVAVKLRRSRLLDLGFQNLRHRGRESLSSSAGNKGQMAHITVLRDLNHDFKI
jgi:hypothetical protein